MGTYGSLVDELAAVWSSQDGEGFADLFTPGGVRHEWALPGARLTGRAAIARHAQGYMSAVPDCTLLIRDAFADGDRLTVEWTFAGTHAGDLPGLPARGEHVELPGVSVCRVEGGRFALESVYWDAATLLAAAGVIA